VCIQVPCVYLLSAASTVTYGTTVDSFAPTYRYTLQYYVHVDNNTQKITHVELTSRARLQNILEKTGAGHKCESEILQEHSVINMDCYDRINIKKT
jgi:hypothetical protein